MAKRSALAKRPKRVLLHPVEDYPEITWALAALAGGVSGFLLSQQLLSTTAPAASNESITNLRNFLLVGSGGAIALTLLGGMPAGFTYSAGYFSGAVIRLTTGVPSALG